MLPACQILVSGWLASGSNAYVGPSTTQISAAGVELFVHGSNVGGGGAYDSPPAAMIGPSASVAARIFVPNGTLVVGPYATVSGSLVGQHVEVGPMATVSRYDEE